MNPGKRSLGFLQRIPGAWAGCGAAVQLLQLGCTTRAFNTCLCSLHRRVKAQELPQGGSKSLEPDSRAATHLHCELKYSTINGGVALMLVIACAGPNA